MIKPFQQDETFLDDLERSRLDLEHFHVWWLGQSGFLIQWDKKRLLIDPYLSDSLTKKYASTDKPHVRMTERVIAPEKLKSIDLITSSHIHTDHLDPETLRPLLTENPDATLVIPEANREVVVDRLEMMAEEPVGMDAGRKVQVKGITIHAVPAAHETLEYDPEGHSKFLGYIFQFGNWTVYHSGDTVRFPGMTALLRDFQIDLALLPINGAEPERRVAGNLSGEEAAIVARDIGAKCVIPCHYEMFEFNTASPQSFIQAARALQQPYAVLRAGEGWSSADLPR